MSHFCCEHGGRLCVRSREGLDRRLEALTQAGPLLPGIKPGMKPGVLTPTGPSAGVCPLPWTAEGLRGTCHGLHVPSRPRTRGLRSRHGEHPAAPVQGTRGHRPHASARAALMPFTSSEWTQWGRPQGSGRLTSRTVRPPLQLEDGTCLQGEARHDAEDDAEMLRV